jgi:hypothetical protein
MPTHYDKAVLAGAGSLETRVSTREELEKVLRERTPAIIGNRKLARPFERLLWARELRLWYFGAIIAFLIAYGISHGYGLRGKFDWDVTRRSGEIVLTPPSPR